MSSLFSGLPCSFFRRAGALGCLSLALLFVPAVLQGCSSGSSAPPAQSPTTTAVSITTSTLPGGSVGVTYGAILTATGGSGSGYSFSVASGSLPAGISLSTSGSLSGTPTSGGTFNFSAKVVDSAGNTATAALSIVVTATTPLTNYQFTGDTSPVHDPSIIRQGSKYYVFVTDAGGQTGFLPIRCSNDKLAWNACGYVFSAMPSWVATKVPAAVNLWAPDISFFNGSYHLYYTASSFGSQTSAIGLATSPTLDQTDPAYKWTDQGPVLTSTTGANFNAIDPNILVDTDGTVWMSYGSYWNGIFQQQINVATGQLAGGTIFHLAQRAASVAGDPVEGSSIVKKGSNYFLFVSWDSCCSTPASASNYKIVVGRGTSRNGPFRDQTGLDMVSGGGTILLQGDGTNWIAPGGQTAYIDATAGDLLVFHALSVQANYLDYLFVRSLNFSTGWPVIGTDSVSTATGTATATTLTVTPNPAIAGAAVSLTAAVSGSSGLPTGSVSFFTGSALLGSCTLNASGVCNVTNSSLAVGSYPITAVYSGDAANAGSTSAVATLTVQPAITATQTSVQLTASMVSPLQGIPVTLYATAVPAGGSSGVVPTGSVVFSEGANILFTGPLDSTGRATLNTAKLAVGAHSIVASYSGASTYLASKSTALTVTVVQPAASTYTNPLPMTDSKVGAVTSCPDPAIIKSQTAGVDTWYMYCTGDPHSGTDVTSGGFVQHLLSIFQSSDLVTWTSVGDALPQLPSYAGTGALMWAPAIKYLNGKYYLYYIVTTTTYPGGSSAIGVATSTSAAGPFTDSGKAVILPEIVPPGMDGAGQYRWVFDPDVIADSTGQLYILYGSFQGGISVRKLSADGFTSDPSTETLIANDQRYEGGAWIQNGGYYYLLASATNCCAGPLTGYGVFAGRATTPMGPYLDAAGNSLSAINVGGTPVLAMNGNTIVGPGGGSPFVDESGRSYYVYHEVVASSPYFTGTLTTQRPAAIDAIDWVNGWPVVRGGFGPSDAASPQPKPVAQPGGNSSYTLTQNSNDSPNVAVASLSDEFNGGTLSPQWTSIHSLPKYTLTGSTLNLPTVSFDTTNAMGSVPILSEATPAGDYMVEVKLSSSVPDSTVSTDFAQGGLLLYGNDANYLRIDLYANSDTRQVEFIKGETPEANGYPTWSATDLAPATAVSGQLATWIRLAKRTVDGKETYTGYSSVDGSTWVRCGTWTHNLGSAPSIGLYGGNLAGYTISFDYVHVSTLQ